jgi:hypothetical protein
MADDFEIVNGPDASILSNIDDDLEFQYCGDVARSPIKSNGSSGPESMGSKLLQTPSPAL